MKEVYNSPEQIKIQELKNVLDDIRQSIAHYMR